VDDVLHRRRRAIERHFKKLEENIRKNLALSKQIFTFAASKDSGSLYAPLLKKTATGMNYYLTDKNYR
jgi:hypothetical protein